MVLNYKNLPLKILGRCMLISLLSLSFSFYSQAQDATDTSSVDYFDMSLEDLMNIEVSSTSLTEVKNNLTPVPSITISQNDILVSGARSLDELLEIYVPGFTMMYKGQTGHSIGVRGIVSDRNNKVLLLVNGRIMNERTLFGVLSERSMTMLADIDKIEVIQSPQSSLYGPGAISFIINIFTKTGLHEDPANEIEITQGVIDQYSTIQARHSKKVNDNFSYSAYYGGDLAQGASMDNSPIRFGFDGTFKNGDTLIAYEDVATPEFGNLNASAQSKMRHKAHAEIKYKDLTFWSRYTKSGIGLTNTQQLLLNRLPEENDSLYIKNQQFTAFAKYNKKFGKYGIDARLSYDKYDRASKTDNTPGEEPNIVYGEGEIYSRVIFNYEGEKVSIAAGPAVSIETFGLPGFGTPTDEWVISGKVKGAKYQDVLDQLEEKGQEWVDSAKQYGESWTTKMISGIVEMQYSPMDKLNVIVGARLDKHDYTASMFSPRASVVYRPSPGYLVRGQYTRSNRRNDDLELREAYLASGEVIEISESINFFELSGDVKITEQIMLQPSIYFADYDNFGWDWRTTTSKFNGTLEYWGAEMSAIFRTDKGYGRLSHNYIQQTRFTLPLDDEGNPEPDNPANNMTILGGDYSNSFRNYPDHLTKAYYQHKINDKMMASVSLQITWYLQGAHDGALYQEDILAEKTAAKLAEGKNPPNPAYHQAYTQGDVYTEDRVRAFSPSAYMHIGYVYNITDKLRASIYGYNLLGLVNKDLNKRSDFQRNSMYRIQPVSTALKIGYSF